MVFPEVFLHIVLNLLAETLLDEVEVIGLRRLAPCYAHEVGDIFRKIILKRRTCRQYWNNTIIVNNERGTIRPILIRCHFFFSRVRMSYIQSRTVKTVTTHPNAHHIADELLDDNVIIPDNLTILDCNFSLLEYGHFIKGNIRCQFILQSIDFNELTVKLFFIGMKAIELCFPVHLIHPYEPFQLSWFWSSHIKANTCYIAIVIDYRHGLININIK